jgi:hypothetical protein
MAAQPAGVGSVSGHQEARWWPAALALVVLGVVYAFVSASLTLGPPWLLLAILALGTVGIRVLRWRELWVLRRYSVMLILGVATLAVSISAVYLVAALLRGRTEAGDLLRDAGLLWVSNVLVFALWYWEMDGGGPAHRHQGEHDFLFPQMTIHHKANDWTPEFLDYLFLAFNTSTAFSPTDTMVLARRAKALMMLQSLISLVTIAVLAARAINTL